MTTYELRPEVRAYYDEGGEDVRIRDGRGRLELVRTRDVLRRVLPPPPASVLDVGGASGAHAQWLAADGYAVHVVDPVPRHVETSAGLPGVTASLGDARALVEADGSYDVVLLLGPLYHLTERAERVIAVHEAARVVRAGGPVVAATISRFAALFDGLRAGWYAERAESVHHVLATATSPPTLHGFTTAYFHRAGDVPGEFADAGLGELAQYLVEGPAWWFGELSEQLDDPARLASLLDGLRRVEREPSLLDASAHVLTVGRHR